MELIKNEKIESNKQELQFKIDAKTFEEACSRVYRREVGKINVPGFRRGKAPRPIVEKMYGKGVFYEDAINDLIPENYEAAVKEAGIEAVGRPEFDVDTIDENGVIIKAVVYIMPEVKIENYRGIAANKTKFTVTDEEIDHEIGHVRERNAREIEITDRPAAIGDVANIDYEGFCDGVAFEGGKGEGHSLKLGSGSFIPGFEEQVAGHNIGDEFDVNVTFPTEYHAPELAGKEAIFKCKLNSIKADELPALDDEFVKDVSEFDTMDEYRADMKAKITERKEKNADAEVEEQLIDYLVEHIEADIPQPLYDAEIENIVRDYDMRLRSQGLDLATYMKYTGMDLEKLREQMKPSAERQVKTRLALKKIADTEELKADDAAVEDEYKRMAEQYQTEIDKVKAAIAAEDIAADLRLKAAVELIKAAAVVTEVEAKAEESTDEADETTEKPKAKTAKPKAKKATDSAKAENDKADAKADSEQAAE